MEVLFMRGKGTTVQDLEQNSGQQSKIFLNKIHHVAWKATDGRVHYKRIQDSQFLADPAMFDSRARALNPGRSR